MSKFKYIITVLAGLGLPLITQAQATQQQASFYEQYQLEIVLGAAITVCFIALLALFTALYAISTILNLRKAEAAAEAGIEHVGFWQNFWTKFNDAVPIEEEETVLTDHAYDGIRELDNRLPPWWLYGFYLSIVFGIVYLFYFHVSGSGDLSAAEYEKEMAQAEMEVEAYLASQGNLIDESNVVFLSEEIALASGKEIFLSKCSACHGQQGEGGVGPNLTDKYWIHGGDVPSIFKTVKYGVPSKGMIPWASQLGPKEMQEVSSYIYTLEGTNPPNGKEPQGDLFEREESADEAEGSETIEEKAVLEAGM